MYKMSPNNKRRVTFLVLSMIAVTVSSAFAIVWMQQQISRSAQSSKQMESQLAETVRKLRYLDERIAGYHQPVVLQGKVAGVLRPSVEDQVVWVQERHLASGRKYGISKPYEATTDLAFLELRASR